MLAKMDPLDRADVHFRLASALHRTKQLAAAKRQVIMALEQAPRYRDAHALLLKIVAEQTSTDEASLADSPDRTEVESPGSDLKKELP